MCAMRVYDWEEFEEELTGRGCTKDQMDGSWETPSGMTFFIPKIRPGDQATDALLDRLIAQHSLPQAKTPKLP